MAKKFIEKVTPVDTFGKIYKQERIGIREYTYKVNASAPDVDKELLENDEQKIREVVFNIKYSIGAQRIGEICESVSNAVFDTETGRYLPEYTDFLINVQILEQYAYFRIPHDLEQTHRFIAETDVVDFVKSKINQEEIATIHSGVYERVAYMKQLYIAKQEKETNEILSQIKNVNDSLNDDLNKENIEKLLTTVASIVGQPKDKLASVRQSVKAVK